MYRHETIEFIFTSVCDYYGVKWQDVKDHNIRDTRGTGYETLMAARKTIIHLLYMELSEDVAIETMTCSKSSVRRASQYVFEQRKELGDLTQSIRLKIEAA